MPRLLTPAVSATKSTCRAYRLPTSANRSFSCSATRTQLPPESPNFVDYPVPEFPDVSPRKSIKGVLPVPRDVLHDRNQSKSKLNKTSPQFLANTSKERTKERGPMSPSAQIRAQYRDEMAEMRRRNLVEGIREMQKRKLDAKSLQGYISSSKAAIARAADERPTPDDEIFTSTSMDPSIAAYLNGGAATRPPTAGEIRQKRKNYKEFERRRSNARKDDLRTLYLQARTFITNPEALDQTLDEMFEENAEENSEQDPRNNVWQRNRNYPPASLQEMLEEKMASSGALGHKALHRRTKAIAEDLTGGRI